MSDSKPGETQPRIVPVKSVHHHFQGTRPNGVEGAIVHFDAGRARSPKDPTDLEYGALGTLRSGQADGYAYVTISRGGTVYVPDNMDWLQWGSHAGQSKCPATGRTGVSRFYVGIELNSPGLVLPIADADTFVPWFEAVRDAAGNPVLDRLGKATVKNRNGELYRREQVTIVPAQIGNIHKGAYVPFNAAQMASLTGLLLWLKRSHSHSFRLDRVFGHDEVAPSRKVDPGGALVTTPGTPITMANLRATLLQRWAEAEAKS